MNHRPDNTPDFHPWLIGAVANGDQPILYGVINPGDHEATGVFKTYDEAVAAARARKALRDSTEQNNESYRAYQESSREVAPGAPALPKIWS